jgi:hypothetical protein
MKNPLEHFIENIAYPHLREIFREIAPKIDFDKAFKEIESFDSFKIFYVSFAMLRTNLLYGKYIYEIHVYNKNWFLNDFVKIGEIDVSSIFDWIEETKEYFLKEAKRYVGKINESEIDNIISTALNDFEELFSAAFNNCGINKQYDFTIYTGELYGNIKILFERAIVV